VLGDVSTVFGDLPPGTESEALPVTYRSHGSLHERRVPLVACNNQTLPYASVPRYNKDLLQPLTGNWLRALEGCPVPGGGLPAVAKPHRSIEMKHEKSSLVRRSTRWGWWRIFGRRVCARSGHPVPAAQAATLGPACTDGEGNTTGCLHTHIRVGDARQVMSADSCHCGHGHRQWLATIRGKLRRRVC
jgi:hypothetical protein